MLILGCQYSLFSSIKVPVNRIGEDTISINKFFKREVIADETEVEISEEVVISPWIRYEKGPKSSMAVLITNPNCSWFALARGLKTIGVPFIITDNYKAALEHNVVMVYPELNTNNSDVSVFFVLRDFVRNGGILIGTNIEGLGLGDVFGFTNTGYAGNINSIELNKTSFITENFDSKKDQNIDIRSIMLYMKSVKYINPVNFPIATFDNGGAAILENSFGKGKAYAIGFDIGSLLSRGYNGKKSEENLSTMNQYMPNLDVFLRLIRVFYREGGGVTLGTCQHGMHLSIIMTHNIGNTKTIMNSLEFAKFEKQSNINSTYFMRTNYIKYDYKNEEFFLDESINVLNVIKSMNFEIASNAVTNSKTFMNFLPGDNTETYNSYHPEIDENELVSNGSVSGELRASKQLLDSSLNNNVLSFRPGYLSYPKTLPQALASANYKFSSSISANDVLTHLPYQLTRNSDDSLLVPVFEFPVTVDIENAKLSDRLQHTINLAKQISKEDGIMVLSIPPTDLDKMFEFEKKFVNAMIGKAVFKSMNEFGSWWDARNEVSIEVRGNKIILDSPQLIEGLTLLMPDGTNKVLPFFKNHLEVEFDLSVVKVD